VRDSCLSAVVLLLVDQITMSSTTTSWQIQLKTSVSQPTQVSLCLLLSADLAFTHILLLSFFFFRHLLSELAEQNSVEIGHMLGSERDLKTHVQSLGHPIPTNREHKNHIVWQLRHLAATLTAYVFRMKHDIDSRASALTTTTVLKCMNFGPQTASNWTTIFTHPPKILCFSSLPGVTDGD